jgi:hypothetical protein
MKEWALFSITNHLLPRGFHNFQQKENHIKHSDIWALYEWGQGYKWSRSLCRIYQGIWYKRNHLKVQSEKNNTLCTQLISKSLKYDPAVRSNMKQLLFVKAPKHVTLGPSIVDVSLQKFTYNLKKYYQMIKSYPCFSSFKYIQFPYVTNLTDKWVTMPVR